MRMIFLEEYSWFLRLQIFNEWKNITWYLTQNSLLIFFLWFFTLQYNAVLFYPGSPFLLTSYKLWLGIWFKIFSTPLICSIEVQIMRIESIFCFYVKFFGDLAPSNIIYSLPNSKLDIIFHLSWTTKHQNNFHLAKGPYCKIFYILLSLLFKYGVDCPFIDVHSSIKWRIILVDRPVH